MRGKEFVSFGLQFLIRLRVVPERQVEFIAKLGRFRVCERVHRAGILDDPIIDLCCVEILLQRIVLLTLEERVVRAVQDEYFRFNGSRPGRVLRPSDA